MGTEHRCTDANRPERKLPRSCALYAGGHTYEVEVGDFIVQKPHGPHYLLTGAEGQTVFEVKGSDTISDVSGTVPL